MKAIANINSELMGVTQVHEYLNGLFEKDNVRQLMKDNEIETVESGEKKILITKKAFVDRFIDSFFKAPYQNDKLNINIIPRKLIANGLR